MSLLPRVLEPEVMDSPEEARDYNEMDHSEVNRAFVADLLAFADVEDTEDQGLGDVLDMGTGTALIPIELCQQHQHCRVIGIDLAIHMLELARYNIEAAGLIERIELARVDAKGMSYDDGLFDVVMSNSIIHHIPEPLSCLEQMVRVTRPGGVLFVRDLMRPYDDDTVQQLVHTYAGEENEHSRQMFDDSLRAALSLEEIRQWVEQLGFQPETVSATTDRHWTWAARKPAR